MIKEIIGSISTFDKKKKFIVIVGALVVAVIVICIVLGVRSAKYNRIVGRYKNPETGKSIKITYENSYYTLSGLTYYDETLFYYCYPKVKGDFKDRGDGTHMKFHYYGFCNIADEVSCRYNDDGVEEIFYFESSKYIKVK